MTREEAIEQLKQKPIHYGVSDNYLKTIYEAIDIAIKALEQQPCDDCISRQAVLDIVNNPLNIRLDAIIKALPSVIPKEKTGHWINKTLIYKSEAGSEYDCYTGTCSVCGETQECWNYCGGCGAKMVEPQESEVGNG